MESQYELSWQEKYDFFLEHFLTQRDANAEEAMRRALLEADRTRIFDFTRPVHQS